MPRTDRLNNATGDVIFAAARVGLIHRMEFAATACHLGIILKTYFPVIGIYLRPLVGHYLRRVGCM